MRPGTTIALQVVGRVDLEALNFNADDVERTKCGITVGKHVRTSRGQIDAAGGAVAG